MCGVRRVQQEVMEAPVAEDASPSERGSAPPVEPVKRPMNSFLLYSNEMRPILQAQHRDSTNAQISKMLGAKWKAMTPLEKQSYVDAAAKVKIEFKVPFLRTLLLSAAPVPLFALTECSFLPSLLSHA